MSFSVGEGESFGIIGLNGAGKTTAVECVSGLRIPDSGSISIYGLSPHDQQDEPALFAASPPGGEPCTSRRPGRPDPRGTRLVSQDVSLGRRSVGLGDEIQGRARLVLSLGPVVD